MSEQLVKSGNFELSGKGEIDSMTQVNIFEAQRDIDLWNDGVRSGQPQDLRDRITLTKYKHLCNLLYIRLNEIYGTLPEIPVNIFEVKT